MTQLEDIAAPIPENLLRADELLTRYGRWARTKSRGYKPVTVERQFDAAMDSHESLASWQERCSRVPRDVAMPVRIAVAVQNIVQKLPFHERIVLHALYVPKATPARVQLQIVGVSARNSRVLHISGLRRFDGVSRSDLEIQRWAIDVGIETQR